MQLLEPELSAVTVEFKQKFNRLGDSWERKTRNLSSTNAIERHPLVQQIIEMGEGVIPLILRRMKDRPWFWFDALLRLSNERVDPVKPSMYGDILRMTEAWLQWGTKRGKIYSPNAS